MTKLLRIHVPVEGGETVTSVHALKVVQAGHYFVTWCGLYQDSNEVGPDVVDQPFAEPQCRLCRYAITADKIQREAVRRERKDHLRVALRMDNAELLAALLCAAQDDEAHLRYHVLYSVFARRLRKVGFLSRELAGCV